MGYWENLVLNKGDTQTTSSDPSYYNDLIILATSLLLDLSSDALDPDTTDDVPDQPVFRNHTEHKKASRWQVGLSMEILRRPKEHEKWSRCFLGAWPMLILGYGATSAEEITTVKDVLSQIRQRIGYGEVQRIQEELGRLEVYPRF
ncbi:hypothetical protein FSARC_1056 [Fusarium sarcochroum]|uniref:Uncharacterized protein n=1 Tax=Fusarium sarcochroum TaxID=1208366 RepID=A0A8H4U9U2_9HYPO|nr:hypothetical protein FSARC_1056 [Fusarium sarcochroum]